MIGAFHQPAFVWMDVDLLNTLPPREVVCGFGEIFKYGVIRDAKLFGFLESNVKKILRLDSESIMYVQATCAAIKAGVVSHDEKESGIRIILNCGHTIGHGLEFAGHYKLLKHGEAVLLGMIAESFIAKEMKLLDTDSYNRIVALVGRVSIKTKLSSLKIADVVSAIGRDKKHVGARLRFVLPIKIGEVKVVEDVAPKLIQKAVKEILKIMRVFFP
jgi:3-dehydroquinate synthase